MKRILILFLWIIGLLLNAQTTYYVDADAANDLGNGAFATPYKTITHAESHLVDGVGDDTIFVREGIYNEKVMFHLSSGTAGHPKVLMNYNNESVIIDGTGIDISGSTLLYSWSNYVHFIGLEVRDCENGGGISIAARTNNLVSHCTVHDSWGGGISTGGNYTIIEYCTVYNVAMSNSDGIAQTGESWAAALSARRAPVGCIIRHNIVHDVWGEGISTFEATYTTIEDNIVYDAFSVTLYISDVTDCLIQRNLVYTSKSRGAGTPVGIGYWNEKLTPANARNTIINNIVYGCYRNFASMCKLDGVVIANNTFVNSLYFRSVQLNYYAGEANSIFKNNIVIQEGALACIYYPGTQSGLSLSNNLYNKAYDVRAVGAGDVTSTDNIAKTGTYTDTTYYMLTATTDAIDGGADIGINTDYLDSLRDASPDIGAFEFDPPAPPAYSSLLTGNVLAWVKWATANYNILDAGGGTVSARGVCWKTSTGPTTADSKTTGTGTGIYTSSITGLLPNTTYYLRAYATNEVGTAYGSEVIFTTPKYTQTTSGGKVLVSGGKVLVIK